MQTQVQPKNPALAAVLSALITGLGQIYNGQIGKGLLMLFLQIIAVVMTAILIGFLIIPVIWVWTIYDAYKGAEKINAAAAQQYLTATKQCPQCAERVMLDALVCRYCGYQFGSAAPSGQPVIQPPLVAPPPQIAPPVATPVPMALPGLTQVCANCGKENRATSKFCGSCGAPLLMTPPPTVATDPPAQLKCPQCWAANPAGTRFCNNCGAPLSPDITVGRAA